MSADAKLRQEIEQILTTYTKSYQCNRSLAINLIIGIILREQHNTIEEVRKKLEECKHG